MSYDIITNSHDADIKKLYDNVGTQKDLKILPYSFYKDIPHEAIRLYMHYEALYTLPTTELISFLKEEIGALKAIEICCGSGNIAKALNIPGTDIKLQQRPEIKLYYQATGQPLIWYPPSVEKLEAMQAIDKYKPDVVIGSYVTKKYDGYDGSMYSPHEPDILKKVKKYIHIGSIETHKDKPLMKKESINRYLDKMIMPEWLIVRGKQGFIGVWTNE